MRKLIVLIIMFCGVQVQAESDYWIDVRTTGEYEAGHVKGSTHIPYDEIAEKITALTTDKDAKIHLYCRSGNRAGRALKVLQGMGYSNAHNDGGISSLDHDAVVLEFN